MEKTNMIKTNPLINTFSDKTVFLTGHTGFQGSWLTLWLEMLGAKVIGYSKPPPTNPSLFKILKLEKKIKHIIGDINNYENLSKSIQKSKPDFVIHLAAQALVRKSYINPLETFETNVIGTANVLQSLRDLNKKTSCIIMTSDKCYENLYNVKPHKESDPMGGEDPYSASKGAAELITSSFKNSFFKEKSTIHQISSIRAGNVIGGGDWAEDRLIPDLVRSIMNNKKIIIRNPSYIRPWQFVLESLSGLLWTICKMNSTKRKYNQAWNLGPETQNTFTVDQIVNKISRDWKKGNYKKTKRKNHNELSESKSLQLDSTKAKKLLKWKNVYDINKAINETINWYKSYYEDPSLIKEFSINQIKNYSIEAKKKKLLWAL